VVIVLRPLTGQQSRRPKGRSNLDPLTHQGLRNDQYAVAGLFRMEGCARLGCPSLPLRLSQPQSDRVSFVAVSGAAVRLSRTLLNTEFT
jgi:hypothetical protein